mgnify:CR=1 FL=1
MENEKKLLQVYRHEIKFFINRIDAFLIGSMLKKSMQTDLNGNQDGEYWIRSLYFDSQDNKDYTEKINGFSERKKLRIRIYKTSDQTVKLELKNKCNNYVHKETIQLDKTDAYELMNGNYDILLRYKNVIANKIYAYMHTVHLRPILLIDYDRQAFFCPFDNIRITIDKNLRASIDPWKLHETDIPMVPVFADGRYILEVKYQTTLPGFIRNMLSTINPQLSSVSKYCMCRQVISI